VANEKALAGQRNLSERSSLTHPINTAEQKRVSPLSGGSGQKLHPKVQSGHIDVGAAKKHGRGEDQNCEKLYAASQLPPRMPYSFTVWSVPHFLQHFVGIIEFICQVSSLVLKSDLLEVREKIDTPQFRHLKNNKVGIELHSQRASSATSP